jgi:hypothetical protein
LNVDKDLIDARAEVSRGPWTLRAGYFGQLNLEAGVGVSRALDPDGTADFELTNTDLIYHERYSSALDLTAQVSYGNVRSDFDVTGFPPEAFCGAFPDGVHQDLGLDEDRARAELTVLWTGLEQHWLRAGLGGVFESSDTTEDVRN